ncbi:MAG: hypothetical protein U0452_04065 [Anaerolineae bacterium]
MISIGLGWLLGQLGLPEWLHDTLELLYIVAAWAILWGPLEAVCYSWLPNFLSIRVYRTIKRGEFAFEQVTMSELDDDL